MAIPYHAQNIPWKPYFSPHPELLPAQIAKMSLTGDVLDYGFSLVYVMAGAVMGCRPGGEFLAAHQAAQEVRGGWQG